MPAPGTTIRKFRLLPVICFASGLVAVLGGLAYLNRPAPKPAEGQASAEAKSYLRYLELKDVTMQASENFMNQQVVEIQGSIGNAGPRPLRSIDVYCLFYGVDGREIHRERVPVVPARAAPLKPGETRRFRLPFDSLPNGWNQALPKMVIAGIDFAG
jgi:hypothetical protein